MTRFAFYGRLSTEDRQDSTLARPFRHLSPPVQVHYAFGGDCSTSEGQLMVAIGQAIDEFERGRLKRETRRGQRQNTLNGYRSGGRPPYGYKCLKMPHPVDVRARRGDTKSRLALDPLQAPVLLRIFRMWVVEKLGFGQICDRLNAEGIPSPTHADPRRNARGVWSRSTVRALLQNQTYLGRLCWGRTDHSMKRERGRGSARRCDESEWAYSEVEHPAIVSRELFDAAQRVCAGRAGPVLPGKAGGSTCYRASSGVRAGMHRLRCSGANVSATAMSAAPIAAPMARRRLHR